MGLTNAPGPEVREELLEAIRSFPVQRQVDHCGVRFEVDPFAFYANCPRCGTHFKLRGYSAGGAIEDVFDAVFEWMNRPGASDVARHRQLVIEEEVESEAAKNQEAAR